MEYKVSFFIEIFANLFMLLTYYLGVWVIFRNFESIQGWKYHEIQFLLNMNWFAYSISGFFLWAPMLNMGNYIKSGEFDLFLISAYKSVSICYI